MVIMILRRNTQSPKNSLQNISKTNMKQSVLRKNITLSINLVQRNAQTSTSKEVESDTFIHGCTLHQSPGSNTLTRLTLKLKTPKKEMLKLENIAAPAKALKAKPSSTKCALHANRDTIARQTAKEKTGNTAIKQFASICRRI